MAHRSSNDRRDRASRVAACLALAALGTLPAGCERAWRNGLIDPTQVGRFDPKPVRNEIRRTLGPLDEPSGIPGAVEPTREDLIATYEEPPLQRGDVIDLSVFELLQPGLATDIRRQVNEVGYITLPVLGAIKVTGLTPRQLELELINQLQSQDILRNPEVSVTVVVSQAKRFSVVGNVNRPGEYPIPRADYRLLEVIGAIGPLSALQENVYVMRGGLPAGQTPPGVEETFRRPAAAPTGESAPPESQPPPAAPDDPFAPEDAPIAPSLGDITSRGPAPSSDGMALLQADDRAPPASGGAPAPSSDTQPSPPVTTGASMLDPVEDLNAASGAPPSESRPGAPPTNLPSHTDFLEVLEQPPTKIPELESLTSRKAPASKFIFLNGDWVEVTETAPAATAEGAPAPAGPGDTTTASKPQSIDWEALGEAETPLRVIEIPVEKLMNGEMRYNIVVRSNDIINVPAGVTGEYYITGHVSRPGAYALGGREVTVKEAIASAGGFSLLAWPSRCEIVRRIAGDQEEIRSINLDKIFSGEEPDFFVRANDIINVGTTAVAPFLATVRNAFRMSYGFGFVYDRNYADEDTFFAEEALRSRRRAERIQRGFPP